MDRGDGMPVDAAFWGFIAVLNSESWVPANAYRRNHPEYTLLCHVNMLAGAFAAGNLAVAPVHLDRACRALRNPAPSTEFRPYRQLAIGFLTHAAYLINTDAGAGGFHYRSIPAHILYGGPQTPPGGPPLSTSDEGPLGIVGKAPN